LIRFYADENGVEPLRRLLFRKPNLIVLALVASIATFQNCSDAFIPKYVDLQPSSDQFPQSEDSTPTPTPGPATPTPTPEPGSACRDGLGFTIAHGSSRELYRRLASVPSLGIVCEKETRFCQDGMLSQPSAESANFIYPTCYDVEIENKCNNEALNGGFKSAECLAKAGKSCRVAWELTVQHGQSIDLYINPKSEAGAICQKKNRLCQNGQFFAADGVDPEYIYSSCTDTAIEMVTVLRFYYELGAPPHDYSIHPDRSGLENDDYKLQAPLFKYALYQSSLPPQARYSKLVPFYTCLEDSNYNRFAKAPIENQKCEQTGLMAPEADAVIGFDKALHEFVRSPGSSFDRDYIYTLDKDEGTKAGYEYLGIVGYVGAP
jgi:hypothetical protein